MFKLFKIFVAACFCGLSLLCLAGVFIAENAPEHVKEKVDRESQAKEFAREWVLSKLKYPETADFVFGSRQVHEYRALEGAEAPDTIGVTGEVRAKNAFGTELLYSFDVRTLMDDPKKFWWGRLADETWYSPEYLKLTETPAEEVAEN